MSSRRRSSLQSSSEDWQPESLYSPTSPTTPTSATPFSTQRTLSRPPPSSFPFQAYPGNPDPGMPIPGSRSRRSSVESLRSRSNSVGELDLARPYAPFMSEAPRSSPPPPPSNDVHSQPIPRSPSANFRAPFLSPASRPSSSVWAPPSYPNLGQSVGPDSPAGSSSALALPKAKPPLPSTRLAEKLTVDDKPWLKRTPPRERLSWWLTVICIFLGFAGAAVLCFFGATTIDLLDESQLCQVLNEDFSSGSLNTDIWKRDIQLGGFGNGEFQITTDRDDNLKIQNNQLYIIPTVTSDTLGRSITDGDTYQVDGCTETGNQTACQVTPDRSNHVVINPAMSARLNTSGTASIKYGKVEVKAKNPRGDWLWPAIWMLPEDSVYGPWPLSGEIDIMEARGNLNTYGAQGVNFVRSSLNYGPMQSLITMIFGWWQTKRGGYNEAFHTYTLEWTENWMRIYVDNRLQAMLDLKIKKAKDSFFNRGHYPATAQNGSTEAVVSNIYENGGWNAPFDQKFFLIIDLAVGGTSGWFPDGVGDKPWHDGSATAMADFADAQDTWKQTWPESIDDRAFRIDSVKMWQLGGC